MDFLIIVLGILIGLVVLIWVGLRIQPRSFPAFRGITSINKTIPLPGGLPAPVERFFRRVYGENVPVIESAVISGRASLRINDLPLRGRFRFTHIAGQAYRHYIEATFFGLPVMRVNEHYLDGKARMELPFGTFEDDPRLDQGANLGLWGEGLWLPAIFLTDARVRWEALDENSAILVVPFEIAENRFIVRFDPKSGLVSLIEAMRYKGVESETKTLWIDEALSWEQYSDLTAMRTGAVTWFDEGRPWAVFTAEEIVYNVDIGAYIRAKGL